MKAVRTRSLAGIINETTEQKFWRNVRRAGQQDCWEWTGALTPCGYGRLRPSRGARSVYAHRVAYELFRAPVPPGLVVCHECDSPSCVNPAHLKAAPQRTNIRDARDRNRLNSANAAFMEAIRPSRTRVVIDGVSVAVCHRGHLVHGRNAHDVGLRSPRCRACDAAAARARRNRAAKGDNVNV